MKKKMIIMYLFGFMLSPFLVYGEINDYLILQDIDSYKFITQTRNPLTKKVVTIPGYTIRSGGGNLSGADHFDFDHGDVTYETKYESDATDLGVRVQVTQHAGTDSDKWLLHEVEDSFRMNPKQDSFRGIIREIDGNLIFTYRRGTHYSWISSNVVVDIRYTDLQKAKPEPLEIVSAYLRKFLSTIPSTLVADRAHDERWIKDEMERRLWLCDRWLLQVQMGKVELNDALKAIVDHMNTFLDYRDKYYGIAASTEKDILGGYLDKGDGTSIKNKLAEYKSWWNANKTRSINLP